MADLGIEEVQTLAGVSDPLQTMNIAEEMGFKDGFTAQTTTAALNNTFDPNGLG